MSQRVNYILRCVVGAVFILSGVLKCIDTSAFADIMSSYGAEWFGYGAPVIIGIEVLLGLLLLFNIAPRWIAAATAAFIVGVSSIFLYGVLGLGITNCGCFGPLSLLNSKPWLTFTRNAVLIALLVPSLIKPQEGRPLKVVPVIVMALVMIVVMLMCGWSLHGAKCVQPVRSFEPMRVEESVLANYIQCDPDSTYYVFAFSYYCPFCQNSVLNVNQYQTLGVVDKVIGLAIENEQGRERFHRLFDVDFEIREIPEIEMMRISWTLPTVFHIRHDSIVSCSEGLLIPSPAIYMP